MRKKIKSVAEIRMLSKVGRRQERSNVKGLINHIKNFKLGSDDHADSLQGLSGYNTCREYTCQGQHPERSDEA